MMVTVADLGEWTLRSSLVLALTLGIVSLLPRGRADRRHALLVTGLLLGVVLPAVCSPLRGFELPILPAGFHRESQIGGEVGGEAMSILATGALAIWLIGCLLLAGRLVWGHLQVRRWTRRSLPLLDPRWLGNLKVLSTDLELRRPAALRVATGISGPLTCGIFRPAILVPESARRWTVTELRATLAHELGHVARRDCAARLVTQVLCVLQWFNPLVWILRHRLLAEQEEACDRLALRSGFRPSQYATALVAIRRALVPRASSCVPLAASPLGEPDALARRLTGLLGVSAPRTTAPAIVLAGALTMLALPLATLRLTQRPSLPATEHAAAATSAAPAPAAPLPTAPATMPGACAPRRPSQFEGPPAESAPTPAPASTVGPVERRRPTGPRKTDRHRIRFAVFGVVRVVVTWAG